MSDYIIDNDEVVEKALSLSNKVASCFRRSGMNVANGPALVEELAMSFLKYAIRSPQGQLNVGQRLKAIEFSVESFNAMIEGFSLLKEKEAIEEMKGIFKSPKHMANMILEGSDTRCDIMTKLNNELAKGLQPEPKSLKR